MPPCCGGGLLQERLRVCEPPPHVAEQPDHDCQLVQPPLTDQSEKGINNKYLQINFKKVELYIVWMLRIYNLICLHQFRADQGDGSRAVINSLHSPLYFTGGFSTRLLEIITTAFCFQFVIVLEARKGFIFL